MSWIDDCSAEGKSQTPDRPVERVLMADVGTFTRGRRFTKADIVRSGIPAIHYGEIYTRYGVSTSETASFLPEALRSQLRFAQPGDVVIAAVGETVKDVGKGVAWLGETEVAIHDDSFMYRSDVLDPEYVSYYLSTESLIQEKDKYIARAKVKRISGENLGRLRIPVPSLDEQRRIVGILNRYNAQLDDLTSALSAEINARQKQYDYYRDRLLTFEGAG